MPRRAEVLSILRIAIPLALAELGWMFMSVVDNLMVGRLPDSANSIGAASVGSGLFYGFAIFGIGLMSGLDTRISHAFGANDLPEARRLLASGMVLALCASPVLVGCIFAAMPLLAALGVSTVVRQPAIQFTGTLVWSLPLLLIYSSFRRYLQGLHHVRPIAVALITSNFVNAAGNWLLIFGNLGFPALGVRGSALSTVVARLYLSAALGWAVWRHDPAALRRPGPSRSRVADLFRLGLPAALSIGLEVGVFNLVTILMGTLGSVSLAAHTIALNAAAVSYMVPLGISSAAAVSVGRALGAGDPSAARRAGWTAIALAALYELISTAVFLLFPHQIARVYTPDAAVVSFSSTLLAIAAVFQLCDGLQTAATGALRGAGDTHTAFLLNLVAYWAVGLPLGVWLCYSRRWGAVGLWDGLCLALVLTGLGLLAKWQLRSLSAHSS